MSIFEKFETGTLFVAGEKIDFAKIEWTPHAAFEGVALKHLVTAKETNHLFSYHLVRVAPMKKIGVHTHATQLETHEVIKGSGVCETEGASLTYEVGTVAILPAGIEHEVIAGEEGLFLFAKFMPPLC